jgi:hypothetical protein
MAPNDPTNLPPAETDEGRPVVGAGIDFTDPNSPLAPYYFRVSHVVAAAFLGVVFAAMTHLVPVWHTDVWGHVRFGEEIVKTMRLPEYEPFPGSPAEKDKPYIHFQWAAQAGGYLLYKAGEALSPPDPDHQLGGGAAMLTTAHALIVTLRLLVILLACYRLTGSMPFGILGAALTRLMGVFVHLGVLRPQIVGELGFAVVLLALSRPVLSRRAVILLPLVFLVWVNCHTTVLMGMVLLGAAAAGRFLEIAWPRDEAPSAGGLARWLLAPLRQPGAVVRRAWQDTALRRLALVIVLSATATMLNPHGPLLWKYSWEMSRHPNIGTFMEEWKPLPIKSGSGMVFLFSVLVLAALARWSPQRFTALQVLLLLAFGWQSLAHSRMLVWWVMVFPWVAVPHLHAVCRRYLPGFLEDNSVLSFRKTVLAAVVAVVGLLWSVPAWWLIYGDKPTAQQRVYPETPVQASAYLRRQFEKDPQRPRSVFVSETAGDFLLWSLRDLDPPVQLSCYSHVHLFSPEHWEKCYKVKSGQRAWQEILDEWGVEYIVVEWDLYEQRDHVAQGKPPGVFDLIDQVKASDRWRVVTDVDPKTRERKPLEQPVFVAERVRDGGPRRPERGD